jgi:hypothetical protein
VPSGQLNPRAIHTACVVSPSGASSSAVKHYGSTHAVGSGTGGLIWTICTLAARAPSG